MSIREINSLKGNVFLGYYNNPYEIISFSLRFELPSKLKRRFTGTSLHRTSLVKCTLLNPFPKICPDHESYTAGFRLDLMNPFEVQILCKNPKIRVWTLPKKRTLVSISSISHMNKDSLKCKYSGSSRKRTALHTTAFTKPRLNSHTNSVFTLSVSGYSCKRPRTLTNARKLSLCHLMVCWHNGHESVQVIHTLVELLH